MEIEKETKAQSSRFFAQKTENEIKLIDEKLEKLMNAYLENALSLAEYREAKNKLVNQKQLLKDKLKAFEQKSNNRFELATKFINTVKQAEIIALQENPEQGRDFLKKDWFELPFERAEIVLRLQKSIQISSKCRSPPPPTGGAGRGINGLNFKK